MAKKNAFALLFGTDRTTTISFNLIISRIRSNRKRIIIWEIIGIIIGLIICFSITKEYVSTVKIVPEKIILDSNLSGATSLPINLTSIQQDAFSYTLYPKILYSPTFLYNLLSIQVPVNNKGGKETVRTLLSTKYELPWWEVIFTSQDTQESNAIGSEYQMTESDLEVIEKLRKKINFLVMDRTDHLELSIKLQNPIAAANLADSIAHRLELFVREYRDNKKIKKYKDAVAALKESKEKLEESRITYAQYADSHQYLSSNTAKINLQRLEIERDIRVKEYEQKAMDLLTEEFNRSAYTPVYFILEPPTPALKASSPRKLVILSYCMFFFGFIPTLLAVIKI